MTLNLAALRDLPAPARWSAVAIVAAATAALVLMDAGLGRIQLNSAVFVLVVLITAFAGMRLGVAFAVSASFIFAGVESHGAGLYGAPVILNGAILAATSSCIAVLVVLLQRRARDASNAEALLRQSELERKNREASEAARAELARTEAKYRIIAESIPFGIWQTDANGALAYVSESFLRLTAMSLEELRNGGWLSQMPRQDAQRLTDAWTNRNDGGDFFEGEYDVQGADGRMYSVLSRGTRLADERGVVIGWAGVNLDITDRKRAIEAVALLEEVGRQLMLSLDPKTILERVASVCVRRFADWAAIDVVQEDGTLSNMVVMHDDAARRAAADAVHAYPVDAAASCGPGPVVRTGRSVLLEKMDDDALRGAPVDARHRAALDELGASSALIVPLIARERVIGTLTLVYAQSPDRYDRQDLGVAEVLGVRTALAYDNALHYAREARVADTLQRASLPRDLPQVPGLHISATYVPGASDSEIGGDWYDAFLLPDGAIGLTIGDVAGKGLHAAVAMGQVRQALRYASLDGLPPSTALARVNKHLCHERTGMVTAVSAHFDPATNILTYAAAGHPAPLIGSADGEIRRLSVSGVPLGLFNESTYVEREERLRLGDTLVFYTDGLIEHSRDIAAGERRLEETLASVTRLGATSTALAIQQGVISGRPTDDVAVLALTVASAAISRIDLEAPAVPATARVLRQALRRLAIGAGLDEERTFALLVAAGEAISNAIEHAYGLREGLVRLRGYRAAERLIVEISDAGAWRAPRLEGRGRGLPLMRSIVDEADISAGDQGTTVRLAVDLHRESVPV